MTRTCAPLRFGMQARAREAAPTRLPPQPIRDLGANAVMRWKEWRARNE